MSKFRPLLLAIVALVAARATYAATIVQEIDYFFQTGPLAGTMAEVRYSYPDLPSGQPIYSYDPVVQGTATYLDAKSNVLSRAQLIFSGNMDIMSPEPYLTFGFDPNANSTGLMNFEVWNTGVFGMYFQGAPEIMSFSCRNGVICTSRAYVVPLPAAGLMLIGGLGAIAVLARRRKCRAAPGKA